MKRTIVCTAFCFVERDYTAENYAEIPHTFLEGNSTAFPSAAMSQRSSTSAAFLRACGLQSYESTIVDESGYESLTDLLESEMDDEKMTSIFKITKVGHRDKLKRKLSEERARRSAPLPNATAASVAKSSSSRPQRSAAVAAAALVAAVGVDENDVNEVSEETRVCDIPQHAV